MESKTKDQLLLFLLVVVIVLLMFNLFYITQEGTACLTNPEIYLVNKLSESNNAHVSCVCTSDWKTFDNKTQPKKQLGFDSETQSTYQLDQGDSAATKRGWIIEHEDDLLYKGNKY